MEKTDRTIALFGDCVTHMVGLPYRHTRAVGLTNWLSIVSPMTEHFSRLDMGQLEPLTLNNYEKRICLLNANKKFLEFLLEEKADFLVLDCMDCRKGILLDSPDAQGKAACITSNDYMRDFGKTLKIMFGEAGRYRYVPATEMDRASYAEAAARICREIRKVYEPKDIILLKHYYAVGYIDGKGMHKYVRDSLEENDKTLELVKYMESLVEENLPGCHVVGFPENVFGDPKHRFGVCSLHYHALYYEYARSALQLIFENHPEEVLLLEQLRCNVSMKFKILQMELLGNRKDRVTAQRIDNVVQMMGGMGMRCPMEAVSKMLLAQDDIDAYLDALYLLRMNIAILLATKDSCGFYGKSGSLDRLRRLGFREFPSKLWWMYAGMMVRGKPVLDQRAGSAEEPLEIRQKVGTHEVFLGARSFHNGNQAILEIDGVNWCQNRRGINLVVFDPDSGAVLDSVSYDSHLMDYFARKSGLS